MSHFSRETVIKIISFAKAHKVITAGILIVVLASMWWGYKAIAGSDEQAQYVLGTVERGTIIASVSSSGQVSASNQVEISSHVSGDVISVPVKAGQKVRAGTLIAQLDAGDAAYDVETARLEYEELITQDPKELRDAENALKNATEDLEDAYTDARASLASVSTDMADVMASVDELFRGYLSTTNNFNLSNTSKDYIERAKESYYEANDLLKELIKRYRTISTQTSREEIETLINESYDTATIVAQAAKYSQDAVVYLRDREKGSMTAADEAYTSITELVSTSNSVVSSLSSTKSSITTSKRTLESAENDLEDFKDGPGTLELRSADLNLRQRQETLSDYSIRAPFDGTIASLDVKVGNTVGSNTAIATLVTDQKLAEISFNEVDAVKVNVGNKAVLTFDAIEDFGLTGQVVEIAALGTVEQGVVSYTVKVGFDSQDERIKSGMTVNVVIQTDTRTDVLVVPASAIKTQGESTYVQVFNLPIEAINTQGVISESAPEPVFVEIGLSDDTNTEIITGLEEGQQIVIRTTTVSATTGTSAQSAPSLFGGGGARGGVTAPAGGVRMQPQ